MPMPMPMPCHAIASAMSPLGSVPADKNSFHQSAVSSQSFSVCDGRAARMASLSACPCLLVTAALFFGETFRADGRL